jgi:hypothetical protein
MITTTLKADIPRCPDCMFAGLGHQVLNNVVEWHCLRCGNRWEEKLNDSEALYD